MRNIEKEIERNIEREKMNRSEKKYGECTHGCHLVLVLVIDRNFSNPSIWKMNQIYIPRCNIHGIAYIAYFNIQKHIGISNIYIYFDTVRHELYLHRYRFCSIYL